jgi:hypothetical protein
LLEDVFAYYWWEDDSDILNFEFVGYNSVEFNKKQKELKEQAVAYTEEVESFCPLG